MQGTYVPCNWNEYNPNSLTRSHWRASLVPAAAVIPAPIAYIKVVAVKKLVVEVWVWPGGPPQGEHCSWAGPFLLGMPGCVREGAPRPSQDVYLEKIRVFKAGASS